MTHCRRVLWRGLTLALAIAVAGKLAAQADSATTRPGGGAYLAASAIHWMDPVLPGPLVYVVYPLTERLALRLEGGMIVNLVERTFTDRIQGVSGLRLRAAARLLNRRSLSTQYYTAGTSKQFMEVSVGYQQFEAILREPFFRDNGNFQQLFTYRMQQSNLTLAIHQGMYRNLSKRLRLEFAVGLGLRWQLRQFDQLPPDAELDRSGMIFAPIPNWRYTPETVSRINLAMPLTLALAYRL